MPSADASPSSGNPTTPKFPKHVKLIIGSEFFLYYSISSTMFIHSNIAPRWMGLSRRSVVETHATYSFIGTMLSIFPGWLSDSLTGKFLMFLCLGAIFCLWPACVVTFLYPGPMNDVKRSVFDVSLNFHIIRYCFEPVRNAFLIEQMELPQQQPHIATFAGLVVLVRYIANAAAIIVLMAFGTSNAQFLFLHSAILVPLNISILFMYFFLKKRIQNERPVHFIYSGGIICALTAIYQKIKSRGTEVKKDHFLDYAEDKCDIFFIYNCKAFQKMLNFFGVLFLIALCEFFIKITTFTQSKKLLPLASLPRQYLDLYGTPSSVELIGYFTAATCFFIWNLIILPIIEKFRRYNSTVIFFGIGYCLLGLAILAALFVQVVVEKQDTVLPSRGYGQLRIFNAYTSPVAIQSKVASDNSSAWKVIPPKGMWLSEKVNVDEIEEFPIVWQYLDHPNRTNPMSARINISECESSSVIITNKECVVVDGFDPIAKGPPGMNDPMFPRVYTLCSLRFCYGELKFRNEQDHYINALPSTSSNRSVFTLAAGEYNVTSSAGEYSNTVLRNVHFEPGGVYALFVYPMTDTVRGASWFQIVNPNSVTMFVLLPQITLGSLGSVLAEIYGCWVFLYTQSPPKLRATIFALGTIARFSSYIVIAVDQKLWHPQMSSYQISAFVVCHFAGLCALIYVSSVAESQTWSNEGAVFQGYPPLATRYKEAVRRQISMMKKIAEAEALEERGETAGSSAARGAMATRITDRQLSEFNDYS